MLWLLRWSWLEHAICFLEMAHEETWKSRIDTRRHSSVQEPSGPTHTATGANPNYQPGVLFICHLLCTTPCAKGVVKLLSLPDGSKVLPWILTSNMDPGHLWDVPTEMLLEHPRKIKVAKQKTTEDLCTFQTMQAWAGYNGQKIQT